MADTCTVTATSRDFQYAVRPGDVFVFTPRLRQASGGIDAVYVPVPITATADENGEISVDLIPAQYYLTVSGANDVRKSSITVPDASAASLGVCIDLEPTLPTMTELQDLVSTAQQIAADFGDLATAQVGIDAAVDLAQGYAQAPEDTAVPGGTGYSALHHAAKAAESAAAAAGLFEDAGGVVQAVADAEAAAGATAEDVIATGLDREAVAAATAAVGVYASTAAGITATSGGQTFWVPDGDYLRLYLNSAGVAVSQLVALGLSGLTEGLRRIAAPGDYIGGLGVDQSGYAAIGILPDGSVDLRRYGEAVIETGGDDPFVWAQRDQSGFVALGVRASGLVYANLPGDGDSGGGSALSRDAVLGMDDYNVWAAEDRSATTRRYISDVDGGTRAYVQRTDIASEVSVLEDSVLSVVLSYGQSLGVGGTGDPADAPYSVTPTHPRQALMLNSGTVGSGSTTAWVPGSATDLAPAVEALHGAGLAQSESPITGLLDRLVVLDAAAGTRKRVYLGHAAGAGGQAIDALAVGTQPWLNLLAALDRVIALAALYEMRVRVDGFVWTQGESNGATDAATYQAALEAIIAAVREECDSRGVSPVGGVPVFMDQVSSPAGSTSSRTPNVAFFAIEAADTRAFVSTAKYHLTLADTVHLQAPDYRVFGEHIAKSVHSVRETGNWIGCRITGAVLAGSTITVTAHVPVGDLVVDAVTVPAVANHGLRYQDDSSSVSIASVSIGATASQACTITITLTGTPSGANPRLSYAYSAATALAAPNFGTVGNLRDSDTMTSSVPAGDAGNGYLHNWMLICPPIYL